MQLDYKDKNKMRILRKFFWPIMTLKQLIRRFIQRHIFIYDELDTAGAAQRIKSNIWFRGTNVWILAFSIVIASVGLNVNSTAVIIGAMLVSPLMGPIIGVGLALGTNDLDLLKAAGRNLLVMVLISLVASTLFFIVSPLALVNPTELEARTSPTIYDVLIALFGGLAGILENSRKERGTVLSGVAIATALMPPLCTAGYGLAHWQLHFFFGALYLFIINSVFIALATYLMVKYLRFETVAGLDVAGAKRRRNVISAVLVVVLVPSIWTAIELIGDNNYERNVQLLMEEDRFVGPRTYVYDYMVKGRTVEFSLTGEPLSDEARAAFLERAASHHIKPKTVTILEHSVGMSQKDMDNLINEVYARTEAELSENDQQIGGFDARLRSLEGRLEGVIAMNDSLHARNLALQHKADSLKHVADSLARRRRGKKK